MNILKLSFKNINNLKGEHEVDFTQSPLSDAGIFAIVGPTGSGKSTLLDVITLALFNQIPRFKKSISKSEIGTLGSVMTHHTKEAEASITYQIKNQTYTSEWKISTARTGNLKDYEMFLYDSAGKPMDLKKSEVPAKNEEIIGLKYSQFIKSIILSQGEFAKFLKAGKNERGELLENITGTSIYRKLGSKCYQKHKELKEQLSIIQDVKGEFQVLEKEERKLIDEQITKLQKEKAEKDKSLKQLNKLKSTKESIEQNANSIKEKELELKEVAKKILEFAPSVLKLKNHDKITPISGELADYKTAQQNATMSQKNLEDYTGALKEGEKSLKEVISKMSTLCKVDIDKSNFMATMSKFEKRVEGLDKDLTYLIARGKEERVPLNQKKDNYSIELSDTEKPKAAQLKLTEHAVSLKKEIAAAKLSETSKPEELRKQLSEQREDLNLLKELSHNYEHLQSETKDLKSAEKKLKELSKKNDENTPLLKKDEAHLQTLAEKLELLHKSKLDQIKIQELEELRDGLKDNEPCPLCGALDHPYTKHLETKGISAIDKNITKAKKEIDTKKAGIDELKKLLAKTEEAISLTTDKVKKIKAELKEGKIATESLIKSYKGKEKLSVNNLSEIREQKTKSYQKAEQAMNSLEELAINKELIKGYERLAEIGKDYQLKHEERNKLFDGEDITAITNKLQDQFTDANTSIEKSKTAIEKETKDLKGAKKILASLESKLANKTKDLGFVDISSLSKSLLSEDEASMIRKGNDQLNKFNTENASAIKLLTTQRAALKEKDSKPAISLSAITEEIEKLEDHLEDLANQLSEQSNTLKRDDENKEKIKSKQTQIDKISGELERWSLLNNLIGDATGSKFANYSQGLTLANLLVFTNKRLQNLSDRYLLDKPSDDGFMKVIDQYQGNIERSVSTLSGGETFLISLALALSLSDMASRNVALDCLFIDEGFGTLDQETLEVAMTTLEKLQTESQKTVGVISHVEALKERIKVQISLEKNAQGYSKIKINA